MKTKISPSLMGVFVLGAFALAIIALLSFGGMNFFSKPQRFVCYFNETIHGLDLGSPVKLRGVRVGRVTDISVRYDAARNINEVAVVCELSRNMIADASGTMIDVHSKTVLTDMVDHGLRAQLGVMGLATGLLYVELNFYDSSEFPLDARPEDPRGVYVPAVPSAISEYQASLSEILSDLKKVDFAGISKEAKSLLVDLRRQVNKIETKELIAEWTKAAQSVQQLAASPELKSAVAGFGKASEQLTAVLAKLESRIEPTGQKLDDTLVQAKVAIESFNSTAIALRRFVNDNQHVGEAAGDSLRKVGEAADAVQRLADYLERNPAALLTGKKQPK